MDQFSLHSPSRKFTRQESIFGNPLVSTRIAKLDKSMTLYDISNEILLKPVKQWNFNQILKNGGGGHYRQHILSDVPSQTQLRVPYIYMLDTITRSVLHIITLYVTSSHEYELGNSANGQAVAVRRSMEWAAQSIAVSNRSHHHRVPGPSKRTKPSPRP